MSRRFEPAHAVMIIAWITAAPLLGGGCGAADAGEGEGAGPPDVALPGCAQGEIPGLDGACRPVGIQGCAKLFVGDDGLCHPSMDKCPVGQIPKFDEGCMPVGISRCADIFLEEDGLCHPTVTKCPEGTFPEPQEGCAAIDGPSGCGTGVWGDIGDAPGTVYVDPAYAGAAGDGSRQRPVTTIAEAMQRVQSGGTVALAAGTYDEPIAIDKPIEVVGRCPSMVRVQGATDTGNMSVTALIEEVDGAAIRGLTLSGRAVGVGAIHAENLRISGVHITGATGLGVLVVGGGARIERTVISGTRYSDALAFGAALHLEGVADVAVTSSAFVDNQLIGVSASQDSTLSVLQSVIEGTLAIGPNQGGIGVSLSAGGQAELRESAVVRSVDIGISVSTAQSTATVTNVLIQGAPLDFGAETYGNGIEVTDGASATIVGSASVDTGQAAIVTRSGEVQLSGSLLRGAPLPEADEAFGFGVAALHSGRVTLSGNAIVLYDASGLSTLAGAPTHVEARGNLFERNNQRAGLNSAGLGLYGGTGEIEGNAFVGNAAVGIVANTDCRLTENLVEGTVPTRPDGNMGRGINVDRSAHVVMVSNAVLANQELGVAVLGTPLEGAPDPTRFGTLEATGDLIQGTTGRGETREWGAGLAADVGAVVRLNSVVVRDNRLAGVLLLGKTSAEIAGCAIDGVPAGQFTHFTTGETFTDIGDGILVLEASTAAITDSRVTGCSRAGVLFFDGSGSVTRTRVSQNRFGVVVQGSSNPSIADNEIEENSENDRVAGSNLPVPDQVAPLP